MVVVLDVEAVPGPAVQVLLPGGERLLELAEREGEVDGVRHEAVRVHVVEGDHHVEDLVVAHREVDRVFGAGHGGLGHLDAVVLVGDGAVLMQVLHEVRALVVVLDAGGDGEREAVRQALSFRDERDDVLPEAVDAHVEPEAHDVFDFFPDLRVVVVEVRLFLREDVEVVLVDGRDVLPGAALEQGDPVVRRQAVALLVVLRVSPDVIVVVGVVPGLAGLLEPHALVRGVVDDEVHEDLHAALVGGVEELLEQLQVAVLRVDVIVVRDVVPVVRLGRRVDGGEPDGVAPEALDVVEFLHDAPEVSDAVAVAVLEGPAPDLIDDEVLVPAVVVFRSGSRCLFLCHFTSTFLCGLSECFRFLLYSLCSRCDNRTRENIC